VPDALAHVKLLVDEDLSPFAASRLRTEYGIDAVHVRDRGMLGASDQRVLACAYREDRILVTANVGDFEQLAASCEVHPGIVLVMDGGLRREEQIAIIQAAVATLGVEAREGRDMINRVLRISMEGHVEIEDLPPEPRTR
jgi:predicted nuclease of predicted toxin-antitoxin system